MHKYLSFGMFAVYLGLDKPVTPNALEALDEFSKLRIMSYNSQKGIWE